MAGTVPHFQTPLLDPIAVHPIGYSNLPNSQADPIPNSPDPMLWVGNVENYPGLTLLTLAWECQNSSETPEKPQASGA